MAKSINGINMVSISIMIFNTKAWKCHGRFGKCPQHNQMFQGLEIHIIAEKAFGRLFENRGNINSSSERPKRRRRRRWRLRACGRLSSWWVGFSQRPGELLIQCCPDNKYLHTINYTHVATHFVFKIVT